MRELWGFICQVNDLHIFSQCSLLNSSLRQNMLLLSRQLPVRLMLRQIIRTNDITHLQGKSSGAEGTY